MIAVFVLAAIPARATPPAHCPPVAAGSAVFEIVNSSGHPLPGATLSFTANNWDSTRVQQADSNGLVNVVCVPAGEGYDVTASQSGNETTHVTAAATEEPMPMRIVLRRGEGRYARVLHGGAPVPGVSVTITDSGGVPQVFETDGDGVARYPRLTGIADAVFEVSIAGFVPQYAVMGPPVKNGPMLFELTIVPVCKPMTVE